jgi:hypothetical protein
MNSFIPYVGKTIYPIDEVRVELVKPVPGMLFSAKQCFEMIHTDAALRMIRSNIHEHPYFYVRPCSNVRAREKIVELGDPVIFLYEEHMKEFDQGIVLNVVRHVFLTSGMKVCIITNMDALMLVQ